MFYHQFNGINCLASQCCMYVKNVNFDLKVLRGSTGTFQSGKFSKAKLFISSLVMKYSSLQKQTVVKFDVPKKCSLMLFQWDWNLFSLTTNIYRFLF